jgi:hypothetical protein
MEPGTGLTGRPNNSQRRQRGAGIAVAATCVPQMPGELDATGQEVAFCALESAQDIALLREIAQARRKCRNRIEPLSRPAALCKAGLFTNDSSPSKNVGVCFDFLQQSPGL